MMCPYCFKELTISLALEELIGKIDIKIPCSHCDQWVTYKKESKDGYHNT
jgi:hypothetical protein